MEYEDSSISAPLRFWFEPRDTLKYIEFGFWFYGQKEFGLDPEEFKDNYRRLKTVGDLLNCLEFISTTQEYEEKIFKFWEEKLSHLEKATNMY